MEKIYYYIPNTIEIDILQFSNYLVVLDSNFEPIYCNYLKDNDVDLEHSIPRKLLQDYPDILFSKCIPLYERSITADIGKKIDKFISDHINMCVNGSIKQTKLYYYFPYKKYLVVLDSKYNPVFYQPLECNHCGLNLCIPRKLIDIHPNIITSKCVRLYNVDITPELENVIDEFIINN